MTNQSLQTSAAEALAAAYQHDSGDGEAGARTVRASTRIQTRAGTARQILTRITSHGRGTPLLDASTISRRPHGEADIRYYTVVTHEQIRPHAVDGTICDLPEVQEMKVILPDHPPLILPRLDLRLIKTALERPNKATDLDILKWVKSNDVMPVVSIWHTKLTRDTALYEQMRKDFTISTYPWVHCLRHLSSTTQHAVPGSPSATVVKHAHMIVKDSGAWFELVFGPNELDDKDKQILTTAVVLTAWFDTELHRTTGFFGIILASPLAQPRFSYTRKVYEMWFILDESRIQEADLAGRRIARATGHGKRVRFQSPPVEDKKHDDTGISANGLMTALSHQFAIEERHKLQAEIQTLKSGVQELERTVRLQQYKLQVAATASDVLMSPRTRPEKELRGSPGKTRPDGIHT